MKGNAQRCSHILTAAPEYEAGSEMADLFDYITFVLKCGK
jgi:hypothetical protein